MKRIIYDYVAVLGVDGMGGFSSISNTPNIDKIFENAATTFNALSMNPTISAENWGAMLLGATPIVHGLTNSSVSSFTYENKALPSIFTLIRRKFPDAYLASVCNWDPINYGIIEHDVGVDMATAENDELLTPLIVERVAKRPKFLFVQFDDVDGAGHHHGYGMEGHIKQIEKTDGYIKQVFDAYERAGILDKTLFVVTADHGGNGKGHGGYTDGEKYVFLAAAGEGIEKSKIEFARTIDIAALVLYALGVELPEFNEKAFSSQVPNGLFPWFKGEYKLPSVEAAPEIRSRETPSWSGEDGLPAIFGESIKLALTFDDEIIDKTGKFAFSEEGSVKYYRNAPNSACAEFGTTGTISSDKSVFGGENFTIALFMQTDRSLVGGAHILSAEEGENSVRLYLNDYSVDFCIDGGGKGDSFMIPIDGGENGTWFHYAISVDTKRSCAKIFLNFELLGERKIQPDISAAARDLPLFIGTDGEHRRNITDRPCTFRIDDLIVFGRAFDENDIKKLKGYYD